MWLNSKLTCWLLILDSLLFHCSRSFFQTVANLTPPPAKQGWYQTLDYNPTLYLLGIDGFQCRSYCMHAELWHTTYCCTVADLASIFPNVKRFHCMCKLSTFLPFSTTWLSAMVKYHQLLSCFYHPISAYVLCILSHHLGKNNKRRKFERNFHPKWAVLAVLFSRQIIKGSQNHFFTLIFSFSF